MLPACAATGRPARSFENLGGSNNVRFCFFQQRNHLFTLHTRKSFEELLDRVASFEMIEKTTEDLIPACAANGCALIRLPGLFA